MQKQCALVTGASYGLGEEFARQLARRGYDLLLTARSADMLDALRLSIQSSNPDCDVRTLTLDLSRYGATQKLFLWTRQQEGMTVSLLVNNAGFGALGEFDGISLSRQRQMIDLNISALVELTHLFLAPMKARRQGKILNIASTAAFLPIPYFAVYAATKAFVLSFSNAVYEEARAYGVHVMAVCPGPTATRFLENAQGGTQESTAFRSVRSQSAPEVVAASLRAMDQGRPWVITGKMNRLTAFISHLAPRRVLLRVTAKLFRRANTGT
jgi:short-subunit dehydrogenase